MLQGTTGNSVQRLTPGDGRALNAFDSNGIVPAVDVGGLYGFVNSGYSPGLLAHKTGLEVARSLAKPRSAIARCVDGLANLFTAAICKATGGRPAGVCNSGGVVAAGAMRLH